MINTELAETLIKLKELKKKLDGEIKEINNSIRTAEETLLEQFASSPLTKISMMGFTLSPRCTLWAGVFKEHPDEPSEIAYDRACRVLKDLGLEEFVGQRFMPQTLSSYVRELDRDGLPIPEQFEGAIKVTEKWTIGVRKNG